MKLKLNKLIMEILKEIEEKHKVVNVRGGRGYGAGHTYPAGNNNKPTYGEQESEEKEEYVLKPVKISKAFKKEGEN